MNIDQTNGLWNFTGEYCNRPFQIQTGHIANQATSSVKVTMGGTTVLVTLVMGKEAKTDYVPFQVVYEERFYASGKMKDSLFSKREAKPSDTAVLNGRIIDRSLRSCIHEQCRNDMQLVVTVLSVDKESKPEILGTLGGSLALLLARLHAKGDIYAYDSVIYCAYDIVTNRVFSLPAFNPKDTDELRSLCDSLCEKDTYHIDCITPSIVQPNAFCIISGCIVRDDMCASYAEEIPESTIYEILQHKQRILFNRETHTETGDHELNTKILIDACVPFQDIRVFAEPISTVRVCVSHTSLLKAYTSALLHGVAQDGAHPEMYHDTMISIFANPHYTPSVKQILSEKLQELQPRIAQYFHELNASYETYPFAPQKNILYDESHIAYIVHPTYAEIADSGVELVISGTHDKITMIETAADIIPLEIITGGITRAMEELKLLSDIQTQFVDAVLQNAPHHV